MSRERGRVILGFWQIFGWVLPDTSYPSPITNSKILNHESALINLIFKESMQVMLPPKDANPLKIPGVKNLNFLEADDNTYEKVNDDFTDKIEREKSIYYKETSFLSF